MASARTPHVPVLLGVLVLMAFITAYIGLFSGSNPGSTTTQERQVFSAQGFRTSYPGGWQVDAKHLDSHTTFYALTSTGAEVDSVGIPPAGTIAVNVDIFPTAVLGPDLTSAKNIQDLAARIIATPTATTHLRLIKSVHPLSLGGRPGASVLYTYRYQGTSVFQKDVVAAHGGAVVFIELDTQHKLAPQGTAAHKTIVSHWRWTGGALVSVSGKLT